ncbi:MAG: class I SAM-dependent methyltransferase [Thermodesulfobacteriota bacterium]
MKVKEIITLVSGELGKPLPPWEKEYLDYHLARFVDTLDQLGRGGGKRLLDIGAFPGHLTLAAQAMGYQVEALTGTNESPRSLDKFIARLSLHHIPTALADVEFDTFPFPDKSFDVVLATEIIEHLPFNPYHLLRETFRVLKPQGKMIISTPNLPKLDNLIHFAFGRSIHPDIRLPFYKTFKSILIGRHIREYTAQELIYMLEEQNKAMYRFEGTEVSYSMCLDPGFSWLGVIPWLIKRVWPRLRSTIFLQTFRPEKVELIQPEEITADGFYEIEEHKVDMGSTGRVLATPFRWTQGRAGIVLPASKSLYQVFFLHLVYLAPKYLPPTVVTLKVGELTFGYIRLSPGREYQLLCLPLPGSLAQENHFNICLECSTWRPSEHGQGLDYYEFSTTDKRDLGIAVGWDGFLREDCETRQDLLRVARRECRLSSFREGNEPRWSPLMGLYLVQAKMKSSLAIGPGDWIQLGLGWHALEHWEQGWVRWSSKRSEVYLEPRVKSRRFLIRLYTGDPALGEEVKGSLEIDWASDRLFFSLLVNKPFSLQSDSWKDMNLDLPSFFPKGGLLRVIIKVDQQRVPACLIPGSKDTRELGLAVAGMAII